MRLPSGDTGVIWASTHHANFPDLHNWPETLKNQVSPNQESPEITHTKSR
jgi:hypothetical protein